MREYLRMGSSYAAAFAPIILLGALSSIAEIFGVSLVILFLFTALGREAEAVAAGGPLGVVFAQASAAVQSTPALIGIILLVILVKSLLTTAHRIYASSVENRLGEAIRNCLHRQYLEVAHDYVRRREEGEMLKILAIESWVVSLAYQHMCRAGICAATVLVVTASLLLISWPITLVALAVSISLFTLLNLLGRPLRRLGKATADVNQEMSARTWRTLQGMRTIRAYADEDSHQAAFEQTSREARRLGFRTETLYALLTPPSEVGFVVLLGGIVWLTGALSIPFATTLACVALLYRLQFPIFDLQSSLLALAESETSLRDVAAVLRRSDKRYLPLGDKAFSGLQRDIVFRHVGFRYVPNGAAALNEASFRIPKGRTTAIVGPSGSGKTTIVNLLLRLDEPDTGDIQVDGVSLSRVRRADWLQRIAVAGQDIELVDSRISANIRVARPDADDDALRDAAQQACILDEIEALQYGLDQWIGPGGANLSGGQRQRLGLARAILRDPDILILDEATSALDPSLEQAVRRNIANRFQGRTIVIITHRLDTVLSADHLICMSEGRVKEEGAPRDLLARSASAFRDMLQAPDADTLNLTTRFSA